MVLKRLSALGAWGGGFPGLGLGFFLRFFGLAFSNSAGSLKRRLGFRVSGFRV